MPEAAPEPSLVPCAKHVCMSNSGTLSTGAAVQRLMLVMLLAVLQVETQAHS